ncbi:MAG TPA: hypothetical protein VL484_19680 [Vicinamibacterales bacterium]|nr:hypothetical protein [Vicinamibacterales bacterium]
MILTLAWRSLIARPVRSAVLAVGFGLGVGVMAVLLGVGDVILEQARAPALVGGGDVRVGSATGRIANPAFVLYELRPGGPFGNAVRAMAPSSRDTVYLRHDGRSIPVALRGGIPSADRAFGDPETSAVAHWTDTTADRRWLEADPSSILRSIDRFHAVPDVPARAHSWAEWLYFNGIAQDGRFYLTFLAGPVNAQGRRTLVARLQFEREGVMSSFSDHSEIDAGALVEDAPDLRVGSSDVRLVGTDYRIHLDLPSESTRARVVGDIIVHANPDRAVPPFELEGAGGWISGYTVPVTSGTIDGTLRVGSADVALGGGTAYHDHNWGFWEGVSWQWGQVQHDGVSFVYGRVRPPADAADPAHVPGFLAVLGPSGPLAFSTDASIEETNTVGSDRPSGIIVRASGESLQATLILDIDQTTVTPMRRGGVGDGLQFLQMRARYDVDARVATHQYKFTSQGSAETFRGR